MKIALLNLLAATPNTETAPANVSELAANQSLATAAYLAAAVLFIFSLGGLSNQETSRRGNVLGITGMALAIAATIFSFMIGGYTATVVAIVPV